MKEAGLVDAETGKIVVEHVFVLKLDQTLQPIVSKLVDTYLLLSLQMLRAMKILSYASAGFLVLYGSSRLLESFSQRRRENSDE